jgi:predicted membrane protein
MTQQQQQQNTPRTPDRLAWLGAALLLLGVVWLLEEVNLIPDFITDIIFDWRTLLIAIGAFLVVQRDRVTPGLILLGIGGFFWLREFNWFFLDWDILLPAVLIFIGISLIVGRNIRTSNSGEESNDKQDFIDDFSLLGGRERTITSQSFRGGKVTALFGGSQIDMRNAELAPGQNLLDVFIMFGGTSIIVPPDWNVNVEVSSVLGGFGDKRYSALKVVPDPEKTLVIKGLVMFGGGEISLTP